ncbi:MAG: universal stress protein [Thermomicrobiales bacterium]|nr:universal stress protein [Thermomicrobiales bacterium]
MFNHIIVPLDGSALAEEALEEAKKLSKSTGSPLKLIRVVDTYRTQSLPATGMALDYSMLSELAEEEIEDAKTYLTAVVEKVKAEGYDVTGDVLHGPIARQICATAGPEDVIVMSSHGRTGIKRWFLGSVAEEVMRNANCNVLLHKSQNLKEA